MAAQFICKRADLGGRRAVKFEYVDADGIRREGFVVVAGGRLVAYENACRHIPISLDYGDGNFFTRDGLHFICHTHGATYEPLTGRCVRGPCEGLSLRALKVVVTGDEVWLEQAGGEDPPS